MASRMAPTDLDLWLEPLSQLPPDCYATVRKDDGRAASQPTPCSAHEASRLGTVKAGSGPVIVDLFQKVGSMTLGLLDAGAHKEATLTWTERHTTMETMELQVRLLLVASGMEYAVAAADFAKEVVRAAKLMPEAEKAAAQLQAAGLAAAAAVAAAVAAEAADAEAKEFQAARVGPLPPLLLHPTADGDGYEELGQALVPEAMMIRRLHSPRGEEERQYSPISLTNCDQILPYLYLGGVTAALDKNALVEQGFRAVCCCCRELEFPTEDFCRDLEYYRVDVEDISREPIELFFPEATAFIHSWVSREQPVLVHCRAGVSRSASTVIAYLIEYQGYSLHDAFFLVRSHRAVITPNVGFMEKLGEFEERVRNAPEPTIEINKYISWYQTPERASVPDLKPD